MTDTEEAAVVRAEQRRVLALVDRLDARQRAAILLESVTPDELAAMTALLEEIGTRQQRIHAIIAGRLAQ